jgi:hypothetical protein
VHARHLLPFEFDQLWLHLLRLQLQAQVLIVVTVLCVQAAGGIGSLTLRHAKGNLTRTARTLADVSGPNLCYCVRLLQYMMHCVPSLQLTLLLIVQFPAVVHGSWASGQPRLEMRLKSGQHPLKAGMVLQLCAVDVKPLQVLSQCT